MSTDYILQVDPPAAELPPMPEPEPDKFLYRVIVVAAAVVAVASVLGVIALAWIGQPVPEALVAIGAGMVGSIGSVLATK